MRIASLLHIVIVFEILWNRREMGQHLVAKLFLIRESTSFFPQDVMSVAFSADNRQIVSGSRDKTIKLWNTLAQCKYTIQEEGHSDWVSCVRFSPNNQNPIIVSCGWDKYVKVWNLTNCKLKTNHIGHTGYLNTVTMSPDGSLCASGGKDAKVFRSELVT